MVLNRDHNYSVAITVNKPHCNFSSRIIHTVVTEQNSQVRGWYNFVILRNIFEPNFVFLGKVETALHEDVDVVVGNIVVAVCIVFFF